MDFQILIDRAIAIRKQYSEKEKKTIWFFMDK